MNRKAECLLQAASHLPAGATIVEIGCCRQPHEVASDGFSTVYLADAAVERGWTFHSVDYDMNAIRIAQEVTNGGVMLHLAEAEKWLYEFQGAIDLLYLDGSSSAEEALWQYEAAELKSQATVVIDDVQQLPGQERGKGNILLDLLEQDGFTVTVYDTEPGYRMAVAKR